jgi:hypothetical protein
VKRAPASSTADVRALRVHSWYQLCQLLGLFLHCLLISKEGACFEQCTGRRSISLQRMAPTGQTPKSRWCVGHWASPYIGCPVCIKIIHKAHSEHIVHGGSTNSYRRVCWLLCCVPANGRANVLAPSLGFACILKPAQWSLSSTRWPDSRVLAQRPPSCTFTLH